MMTVTTMSERNDCMSEMPAALMAVSSELSPRLPKVISELSRMANGKAIGTNIRAIYQKKWAMTSSDNPLPIRSLSCLQRNCIISTNWQMNRAPKNSTANCFKMNMSSFFMRRFIDINLDGLP